MILSFHPCFITDNNIICAGREPSQDDLTMIKAADAVVLPQGCYESLHQMARTNCFNVFPNYDARFRYPGKIGQTALFQKQNVPHPKTITFQDVRSFHEWYERSLEKMPFDFPFVFKFDWGGGGDTVFLIKSPGAFEEILQKTIAYENPYQKGFLIQEYIPAKNRSLRVVVIGQRVVSYWRVQNTAESFCSSLAKGAVIDTGSDPGLQETAITFTQDFCQTSGINLAGFDFLFSSTDKANTPLFLEINYFFGRRGLGGSEEFYRLLQTEINNWLHGLKRFNHHRDAQVVLR
jgi:ribosomal protein S6--L-glutamate ligase